MGRKKIKPIKSALEWMPQGERPRSRLRKRWLKELEKDFMRLALKTKKT